MKQELNMLDDKIQQYRGTLKPDQGCSQGERRVRLPPPPFSLEKKTLVYILACNHTR